MGAFSIAAIGGLLKKVAASKIGKEVGKAAEDLTIAGVRTSLNKKTENTEPGKMDWARTIRKLLISTIPFWLMLGLALDWWTMDQVTELWKLFKQPVMELIDTLLG